MKNENRRPETGLLYSVDDIARIARAPKALIVRLCLEGRMPPWQEVEGRRYWDRVGAVDAIAAALAAEPKRAA